MYTNSDPKNNQGLAIAAFVCGLASITLSCCYLSIPFAAMGILFYCLNTRKGRPIDYYSKLGLWFSLFGITYGIIVIYTLYTQLQDPAFVQKLNDTCRQLYGYDLDEILKTTPFYNIQ